jgi:O-antigen ligase/Tfp pilus assembly protein PilF
LLTAGRVLVLAKAVLVPLIFAPQLADAFALPKSTASHVLAFAIFGVLVLVAVQRPALMPLGSPVTISVALLVTAFALSTALALDTFVGTFGTWRRYLGLSQMLDNAVTFLAVAMLFRAPRDQGRLLGAALVPAGLVAVYSFAQRAGLDPIRYAQGNEAISTFGQPDIAGGYLGVAAITGLAAATVLVRLDARWRLLSGAVGVACVGAAGVVGVRNSALALFAGLVAMLLIAPGLSRLPRRRLLLLLGASVLLFALVVGFSPLGRRFSPEALASDGGVRSRLELWHTALATTGERFVLGLGPDNFAVAYPRNRAEESAVINPPGVLQNSTHNWLLYFYSSAGVVGLGSALAAIAFATIIAVRLGRRGNPTAFALVPLFAYLGQGLVNVNDVGLDWILWASLGVVVASSSARRQQTSERHRFSAAVALAVALALSGVGLVANEMQRVQASRMAAAAQQLANSKRFLEAVSQAASAATLDPRRAEYWSGFGTALSEAGSPSAAATAYLDAAARSPWQSIYWRDAALMKLATGDVQTAERYLRRALDADPYDSVSLNLLARLSLNGGEVGIATDLAERLIRVAPTDGDALEIYVATVLQAGRAESAIPVLVRALHAVETARAHVLLGRVYLSLGRKPEALEQAKFALAGEPDNIDAIRLRDAAAQ